MKVGMTFRGLRQASWQEYLVRFVFGGALTALTGLVAHQYGPTIGGVFLAFPAILPASVTPLARHQRDRKARLGLNGTMRGWQAASLDALEPHLGSVGLLVFALLTWRLLPIHRPVFVLTIATCGWALTAYLMWKLRKP